MEKRGVYVPKKLRKRAGKRPSRITCRMHAARMKLSITLAPDVVEDPTHVTLRKGEGGVVSRGVLKCEQIMTLPVTDVGRRALGRRLSAKRVAEVVRGILRVIGVPVPDIG